jgi:hypothetical protein
MLGEVREDTCTLEDIEIPECKEPQPIEISISASEFRISDLLGGKEPSLLPNPSVERCVVVQFRPKTKRNINYDVYEQRWKKATSLRKAKKYARLLGYNQTHNQRFTFAFDRCALVLPKCKVSGDLIVTESGEWKSNINIIATNYEH